MDLVLAMDFRHNLVVHGKMGNRAGYKPLDWGSSPTAEPLGFVRAIAPKFIYIADLDRIEGTGSHDAITLQCAEVVECCYVDRGCRSPGDYLAGDKIRNIVGTESGGENLGEYHGGFLSIDMKAGKVIPSGKVPVEVLAAAGQWDFEGCILLDITGVGTEKGLDPEFLARMRKAYEGKLFLGGGVGTIADLDALSSAGFDGAIIATALHKGVVPLEWIRRGTVC
ncbi:MAG: nickel transporter [Methanoregula sp.]|nr:nickel transporter [Methanoregula sp.]